MTKRRHLLCDLDEPSACQVLLCKENSPKRRAAEAKTLESLDREMQGLEVNRRVEQGEVGMETDDATKT